VKLVTTVGRNPAPPGMYKPLKIIGYLTGAGFLPVPTGLEFPGLPYWKKNHKIQKKCKISKNYNMLVGGFNPSEKE